MRTIYFKCETAPVIKRFRRETLTETTVSRVNEQLRVFNTLHDKCKKKKFLLIIMGAYLVVLVQTVIVRGVWHGLRRSHVSCDLLSGA